MIAARLSFRACLAALALSLTLAACQNSEERAEEHYQSALELLEAGDLDRATVEFRNVFRLNGNHTDARRAYAAAIRAGGRLEEAYSQYLRLVEQLPDDLEGRIALAEMSITNGAWDEARRHGTRAQELAPEDPRVEIISISLDYSEALDAGDASARRDAAERGRARAADDPGNLLLQRLLIDSALRDGDLEAALIAVDAALDTSPDARTLHDIRLSVLAEAQDGAAVEAQLSDMIARFPEDDALIAALLRFYLSQDRGGDAEAFLRGQLDVAEDAERRNDYAVTLVQFLLQSNGPEAALAEIERLRGTDPQVTLYRLLEASIRFDTGDQETGIANLQALIDEAEPSPEINDAKITLAQMLIQTGNQVGAQRLAEEVLEADTTHVAALTLNAGWLIDRDQADEAIAALRLALEQDPQNAEAMTLMARAHERNGNRELMRDFLSLAVETSGNAPEESLRYANVLIAEERFLLAEEVLIEALRLAPTNLSVLNQLGQVYIAMEDWPRAEQVEARLAELGEDDRALRAAAGLQAARLAAQGRTEDAIGVLEGLAAEAGSGDLGVQVAVVRAHLTSGDPEAARAYAAEVLARDPDNPALRLTMGLTEAAIGDNAAAAERFRRLTETHPEFERAWMELVRALYAQGELEEAEAALAAGLEAQPQAVNLLWAQAGFLERSGDIEGAIAIYEELYAQVPNAEVVANNLASLISAYRDDADSLERAYAIARRLRGSETPAFADTYGWIALRRGDLDEAESHLERAAAGLPEDPLVQYHYARVLAETGQAEAALEQFRRAVALAGDDDARAQFETARAEIARLEAEIAAQDESEEGDEDTPRDTGQSSDDNPDAGTTDADGDTGDETDENGGN